MTVRYAKLLLCFGVLGMLWAQTREEAFVGNRGRYWAFQKVARPAAPALSDPWIRNPIDAFLLDGMRAKQLEPSQPLDHARLIRRVTYDLTGLPATPAEVGAFL